MIALCRICGKPGEVVSGSSLLAPFDIPLCDEHSWRFTRMDPEVLAQVASAAREDSSGQGSRKR